MIEWDDVRYFLAVACGGSVRAAAQRLGVNHATVLRRIAQLEERLGVQMFEKLPSGYRLTAAGEEVLEFADQMEASSHKLETRIFGRDQSVRGLLRVTLAPPLATHLLMPDFADFARLYPDIEMEISSSGELANLTNRDADVAIRVVYDRKTLPLNLHGLKGPELFGGVYIARDSLAAWRAAAPEPIRLVAVKPDLTAAFAGASSASPGAPTEGTEGREGGEPGAVLEPGPAEEPAREPALVGGDTFFSSHVRNRTPAAPPAPAPAPVPPIAAAPAPAGGGAATATAAPARPLGLPAGLANRSYNPRQRASLSEDRLTHAVPAGWKADPTGRHQFRYWNGRHWTENVADAGVQNRDAVCA